MPLPSAIASPLVPEPPICYGARFECVEPLLDIALIWRENVAGCPAKNQKCYRCGFDYHPEYVYLDTVGRWICVECSCTIRLEAMQEAIAQLNQELIDARAALAVARDRETQFRCDMVCENRKQAPDL